MESMKWFLKISLLVQSEITRGGTENYGRYT